MKILAKQTNSPKGLMLSVACGRSVGRFRSPVHRPQSTGPVRLQTTGRGRWTEDGGLRTVD